MVHIGLLHQPFYEKARSYVTEERENTPFPENCGLACRWDRHLEPRFRFTAFLFSPAREPFFFLLLQVTYCRDLGWVCSDSTAREGDLSIDSFMLEHRVSSCGPPRSLSTQPSLGLFFALADADVLLHTPSTCRSRGAQTPAKIAPS